MSNIYRKNNEEKIHYSNDFPDCSVHSNKDNPIEVPKDDDFLD